MTAAPTYALAQWRALGSQVQLLVRPAHRGQDAARRAADLLDAVERTCSRFRPDSCLSRVNQRAGEWVETSELLRQALATALDAARQTDGLVDPTLGLVLAGLGYDRDLAALPGAEPAAVTVPPVIGSWRDVEVDDRSVRVPFGRALDLGSTGKAFAADLVARTVSQELDVDLVVSVGGDVAIGHCPGPGDGPGDDAPAVPATAGAGPTSAPWQVVVCEIPEQTASSAGSLAPSGEQDETVLLTDGGLATSSVVRRRWRRAGREVHHLLDPRTGAPVRPVWRTASVIAGSCAAANTASTAAVVLGDRAVGWLDGRGLAARLVHRDGHVRHVGDWPVNVPTARSATD